MKGLDQILERVFRVAHEVDQPARPKRGRTAQYIRRTHHTRAPHSSQPPAIRKRARKAAHEARRRNRSTR